MNDEGRGMRADIGGNKGISDIFPLIGSISHFLLKNLLYKSDREAQISISVHVQRYVRRGYENVLVRIKI